MPLEFLISALVTLLVVVDPVGLVPAFLALTDGLSAQLRRQVALRACLIAGAILIGAALIGDWLLRSSASRCPRSASPAGCCCSPIASEMVFGVRIERDAQDAEQAVEEHVRNIAAFPLAIPLMAGPGAITATILLAGQAGGAAGMARDACSASSSWSRWRACVTFLAAERIGKLLGVTGNVVLSRLLGVILAALAVQYVVDGVARSGALGR